MQNLGKTSLYISRDVQRWKEKADFNYKNITSCNSFVVKNAYLLPIKKLPAMSDAAVNEIYAGGVQSEDGSFIAGHKRVAKENLNFCCAKTYELDKEQKRKAVSIEKNVVYGGMIIDMFGHVIAEAFSRLWYILEHGGEDNLLAFVVRNEVPQYFWDFMELLGIDRKRIIIVNEVMKCKTVIVPEQAYIMYIGYNPKVCDVYKKIMIVAGRSQNIVADSQDDSLKIYLSRMQFNKHDCINEEYFTQFYEHRGYKVVCPEKLSVSEQVSLIAAATEIVCTAGTLSHLSLFAQDGTKLTILLRCNEVDAIVPQFAINQMKRLEVIIVDCSYNYLPTTHAGGIFLIGPTKDFVNYLEQEKIDYKINEVQMDFEKTAWNYILAWINKYGRNGYPYKRINGQDVFDVVNRMSDVILEKSLTREQMATPKKSRMSETEVKEIKTSLEQLIPVAGKYSILNHSYDCLRNTISVLYDICSINNSEELKESMDRMCLTYDVHISKIGWINYNGEYETVGKIHSENKIEAVRARFTEQDAKISYGVYVEKEGWKYGRDGEIAGTTGKSRSIKGLFFKLDGESAKKYDIFYRAGTGEALTKWHRNGEPTDTFMWSGIEVLEIYIDPRKSSLNSDLEFLQKRVNDWRSEAENAKELYEQRKKSELSLNILQKKIEDLSKKMADAHETIFELQKEIEIQCNNNRDLYEQLEMLQHSFSWKITKPLRRIRYMMLQRKKKTI